MNAERIAVLAGYFSCEKNINLFCAITIFWGISAQDQLSLVIPGEIQKDRTGEQTSL